MNNLYGFSLEKYKAIPIMDDKIQLNSLQNFFIDHWESFDREHQMLAYKDHSKANYVTRLNELFVDGDDVYKDFPNRIEQYEKNYDSLKHDICLYCGSQ